MAMTEIEQEKILLLSSEVPPTQPRSGPYFLAISLQNDGFMVFANHFFFIDNKFNITAI